jgi:hypothetical protein
LRYFAASLGDGLGQLLCVASLTQTPKSTTNYRKIQTIPNFYTISHKFHFGYINIVFERQHMKVVIDLIEDIRESIANDRRYEVVAGLLKRDPDDPHKLVYVGEAPLRTFSIDKEREALVFGMDGDKDKVITVAELVPPLLIADMDVMMYPLKMDINSDYNDLDIVGFGVNEERRKYLLLVKAD